MNDAFFTGNRSLRKRGENVMEFNGMSLAEAMGALGIVTTVESDPNPADREADFPNASHYVVTFTRPTHGSFTQGGIREVKTFITRYSVGSGWTRPPTGTEVMRCVLNDASSIRWESFEGWARDMGYDTDSRKAEATYKAIEAQTDELTDFLRQGPLDTLEEWRDTESIMDEERDNEPPICEMPDEMPWE